MGHHKEKSVNIKDAMSCFTTGVTVVTTQLDAQDCGMTCNSFNTVSLEPAMVLWSIRKTSHSHSVFVKSGHYMVNVLAAHQKDLAMRFATGDQNTRFAGLSIERGINQCVRLPEALAWFDCRLAQVVSAGDHDILIGEVIDFGCHAGHGLAYSQRSFGVLAALED
jgi:3-hydroxy-9,10-secoandrosta-1,3,5(10)-triene-9,17-dione monooxygenase reductase component